MVKHQKNKYLDRHLSKTDQNFFCNNKEYSFMPIILMAPVIVKQQLFYPIFNFISTHFELVIL